MLSYWITQIPQLAGAVLMLIAYALLQLQILTSSSFAYLLLNLIGGSTLTMIAFDQHNWGFFLLEGAWSIISFWGLVSTKKQPKINLN
ncbi:MAG: hypothetical protein V4525_10280 [Pseudomonadota bacterium]